MKILTKAFRNFSTKSQIFRNAAGYNIKSFSSEAWTLHHLKTRGLLELKGTDVKAFLQGLVTNDMNHLGPERSSLYSMILNIQGRVLYDLLIYQKVLENGNPVILIEHDRQVTSDLIKILKRYKIRKKVDIADASNSIQVFAALSPNTTVDDNLSIDQSSLYMVDADPRLGRFGKRILSPNEEDIKKCVADKETLIKSSEELYHETRYKLGIPEGITDLPPGNCFPLESNLAYLNGVCFQKGCYIGQELTARTFHTGVTRKRLMPLEFESVPTGLSAGDNIQNDTGKSVGKFRNSVGKYGLGIIRMADNKGVISVINSNGNKFNVTIKPPLWWPKDEDKGYL